MTFCGSPTDDTARCVVTVSGVFAAPSTLHCTPSSLTTYLTPYLRTFQQQITKPTTKQDDKMLMVWDLCPNMDISSAPLSPSPPPTAPTARQPNGRQRASSADRLRNLVPARAELGLRARHDDQGPPRLARAH